MRRHLGAAIWAPPSGRCIQPYLELHENVIGQTNHHGLPDYYCQSRTSKVPSVHLDTRSSLAIPSDIFVLSRSTGDLVLFL